MRTDRKRTISVSLPIALVIVIQALVVIPARVAAQCPTMSDEGSTFGITRFNPVKAQMWYNDGLWWGAFSDNDTGIHFYSFPNGAATQGPIIDGNVLGIPDALWDGTNLFVAVWKSVSLATFYKFSYDAGTKTYTLLPGFPVSLPLNGSSTSAFVLDKDTTGKLWATYTGTQGGLSDGTVRVIWSTSADHTVWDTNGFVLESGLVPNTLEISAITHFGGDKIGIVWSNQPAKLIGFRYHVDGQSETTWSSREIVDSGIGPRGLGPVADDHLAIKPAPDGRLFLIAKDNDNDGTPAHATEGRLWLYIRSAAGVWGQKTIVQPDLSQLPTRPVLLLDVTSNQAYVIYSDASPSGSGRSFIAHTSMTNPSFDFPCVFTITPTSNPTSTKQNVTSTTGIMAAASTGATGSNDIIFRSVDLTPINPVPTVTSLLPANTSAGSAAFPLTVNGTGFVLTSVVQWNGSDRTTTFLSDTQLTAQITAADVGSTGTAAITVFNPPPAGGLSDPVTFTINPAGLEADVSPRPNGNNNGSVSISDWVQTGRFAAGLDIPNAGSEFQRADSAPRSTFGNGSITISDWVQAGRYAAGLDPVTPASGPTAPGAGAQQFATKTAPQVSTGALGRVLRAGAHKTWGSQLLSTLNWFAGVER
jgi:hypothetical protein